MLRYGVGVGMVAVCQWCDGVHGAQCPKVRSIEYGENGLVRRIEFFPVLDMLPGVNYMAAVAEVPGDETASEGWERARLTSFFYGRSLGETEDDGFITYNFTPHADPG
jgi:hypothetical protein